MPRRLFTSLSIALLLGISQSAVAVPTLQVGAPGGPGEGTFADYLASGSDPHEEDTAYTSGSTILVGGVYGPNTLQLGSAYAGGDDYSAFGLSQFDSRGAVLIVAVAEGTTVNLGDMQIDGADFFASSLVNDFFPNNHDPLKDHISDFYFFDIGDFANNPDAVAEFDSETGAADGEIKSLTLSLLNGFDPAWLHFDVLALETNKQGRTGFRTSLANNPGSHDLTWKPELPPDIPPVDIPQLPEPTTAAITLLGMAPLCFSRRRKR